MKKLTVNTKDTSCAELINLAKKSGFEVFQGKKHVKIKTLAGIHVTIIPRHNKIKRETAKGVVEAFVAFGANIDFS